MEEEDRIMTEEFVLAMAKDALVTAILLAAPVLAASLVVGLVVSLFQAVTQINEVTLTFVPKILAVFATIALFGPWMLNTMTSYTQQLFAQMTAFAP